MKDIIVAIFCLLSIAGECKMSWNISPSRSYMPGNIYHRSSSGHSSSTSSKNAIVDSSIYITNLDHLMLLNTNAISAIYYQYDYQCKNHPNGKPVEFGSDSHGKWQTSAPNMTGYIGSRNCSFRKKIHYICIEINATKYKIEFNQANFNALNLKFNLKLAYPSEQDIPYSILTNSTNEQKRANSAKQDLFNYWNDSKNDCIRYRNSFIYVLLICIVLMICLLMFNKMHFIIRQLFMCLNIMATLASIVLIIVCWALADIFAEYAVYYSLFI